VYAFMICISQKSNLSSV